MSLAKDKQKMTEGLSSTSRLQRYLYGSFIICARVRFPIYLSPRRSREILDYAANNIKIFIARRLIESNGQRLFRTLLPEVPRLPRGRHAGASGFSREVRRYYLRPPDAWCSPRSSNDWIPVRPAIGSQTLKFPCTLSCDSKRHACKTFRHSNNVKLSGTSVIINILS